MQNLPKTEDDFNKLMEEIDEYLKIKGIPIKSRELQTFREVAIRFKINVPLASSSEAKQEVFTGKSLFGHISKWFNERYGNKLKVDFSPGQTVILIKKDPYKIINLCSTQNFLRRKQI